MVERYSTERSDFWRIEPWETKSRFLMFSVSSIQSWRPVSLLLWSILFSSMMKRSSVKPNIIIC